MPTPPTSGKLHCGRYPRISISLFLLLESSKAFNPKPLPAHLVTHLKPCSTCWPPYLNLQGTLSTYARLLVKAAFVGSPSIQGAERAKAVA